MTIKQLGGVFGRNPTFNDVTIEGTLTFDGGIDITSDLTVDGTVTADGLTVDTTTLVVDATNNRVGIGTATPTETMHIVNGSDRSVILRVDGADSTTEYIALGVESGLSTITAGGVGSTSNALAFSTAASGAETERMRIDSSGNLLVGTTTYLGSTGVSLGGAGVVHSTGDVFVNKTTKTATGPGIILDGNGFAYFVRASGVQIICGNDDTGGTSQESIRFVRNFSDVGSIDTTNTATSYNTSSDYRLKENVVAMSGATERVKQLKPSRFNFIADPDKTVDGFLAHEVQDVVPEAITGTKDAMRDEEYEVTPAVLDDDGNVVTDAVMGTRSVPDYQGIDQSKLVPLLVATIQELEARIAQLEGAN